MDTPGSMAVRETASRSKPQFWQFSLRWLLTFVLAAGAGAMVGAAVAEWKARTENARYEMTKLRIKRDVDTLRGAAKSSLQQWQHAAISISDGDCIVFTKEEAETIFGPPDTNCSEDSLKWTFARLGAGGDLTLTIVLVPHLRFDYTHVSKLETGSRGTTSGSRSYPQPFRRNQDSVRVAAVVCGMVIGFGVAAFAWLCLAVIRRERTRHVAQDSRQS